ncbi:MAG: cytochrome C oxidase subunit IV family protein [Thermomicrobiales bacterium]
MTHGALASADHGEHEHPSERKYVEIAIFLTIITLIEVAIWYIDWMHDTGALVPTLFVLSILKFVTVIGYYMHLKFDAPLFRYMFVAGLVGSLAVIGALIALLSTHRIDYSFGGIL